MFEVQTSLICYAFDVPIHCHAHFNDSTTYMYELVQSKCVVNNVCVFLKT